MTSICYQHGSNGVSFLSKTHFVVDNTLVFAKRLYNGKSWYKIRVRTRRTARWRDQAFRPPRSTGRRRVHSPVFVRVTNATGIIGSARIGIRCSTLAVETRTGLNGKLVEEFQNTAIRAPKGGLDRLLVGKKKFIWTRMS